MYPRLYVARELLREDGVIFISIDDNEVSQLKLLCDEVFGEENFISQMSIVNNIAGRSDSKDIAIAHEYALVYQKTDIYTSLGITLNEKQLLEYRFEDIHGKYRKQGLRKRGSNSRREDRPNMYYPIYFNENTKEISLDKKLKNDIEILPRLSNGDDGCWRWGKDTLLNKIEFLEVGFVKKREEYDLNEKVYLNQNGNTKRTKLKSYLFDSKYTSDTATKILGEILPNKIFTSPKSLHMIKDFLINSTKDNDTILDFFAGSGTTAHAVMALNAEDGGNRKFITVQIPEKTDNKSEAYKAGYKTIFDITKVRIEKASEQLQDKSGFKIFETTPMFEGYLDDLEELNAKTTLFKGSELSTDELETLLTTWKVHDGMKLHEPLVAMDLGGYVAYGSSNTLYFMDKGFNVEALKAFVAKLDDDETFEPSKLVLFGYNFDSKHQREFKEALNNYTNKKSIELDMVVRY
ncbi:Type III restriction-modification system methylation subunit [hydrothermal vent metagenome]|uniref:Type III restriction-modification system methylation subunit n=1 Tax=hydrothermal vent metagenome TaxID=652676 RepID=A0A1W1D0Z1_9ZZZZ